MHSEGSDEAGFGTIAEAEPARRRWVVRVVVVAFLAAPVLLALGGTAAATELDPVTDTVDDVTGTVTDTVDDVTGTVTDTVDDVTGTVTDTVDDVTGTVTDTVDDVTGTVTDTVDDVTGTVTDTVDEVTDTVTDTVDPVVEQVTDTVTDVLDPIADQVDVIGSSGGQPPVGDGVDPSTQPPPSPGMVPNPGSSVATQMPVGGSPDRGVTRTAASGPASWWSETVRSAVTVSAGDTAISPPTRQPSGTSPSLPIGSGTTGTTVPLLVLFAGLAGLLALIRPSIRFAHVPRLVACNAAAFALSVERPG
jgi:gas vesicle protein